MPDRQLVSGDAFEVAMEYFDSKKGWIQFAFANEQDVYDLPSTVRVEYRTYLKYVLQNAGYKAVMFWDNINGQNIFSFADEYSAECYEKLRPKKWSLFGSEPSSVSVSAKPTQETVNAVINSMESCGTRIALVVPLSVFCAAYSTPERISQLKKIMSKQHTANTLLLLTSTLDARDSNIYLSNPDGVLQTLMEEVRQAACYGGGHDIYTELKNNMQDRCVFFNDLSRDRIKNTVSRNVLSVSSNFDADHSDAIDLITDFVYKYYHSRAFRESLPEDLRLPENEKFEMKEVDRYLKNPEIYEQIEAYAERFRKDSKANTLNTFKTFRIYLEQTFRDDAEICYISVYDHTLDMWNKALENIRNVECCEYGDDYGAVSAAELFKASDEIDRNLKSLIMRGDVFDNGKSNDNNPRSNIQFCINSIKSSCAPWQRKYRINKVYLLKSYLRAVGDMTANDPEGESWNLYKTAFDLSDYAQSYHKTMLELSERLDECRRQNDRLNVRLKDCREGDYRFEQLNNEKTKSMQRFRFLAKQCQKYDELTRECSDQAESARNYVEFSLLEVANVDVDQIRKYASTLRDQEQKFRNMEYELSKYSAELDDFMYSDLNDDFEYSGL